MQAVVAAWCAYRQCGELWLCPCLCCQGMQLLGLVVEGGQPALCIDGSQKLGRGVLHSGSMGSGSSSSSSGSSGSSSVSGSISRGVLNTKP